MLVVFSLAAWCLLMVANVYGCTDESDIARQLLRRAGPTPSFPETETVVAVSVGIRIQRLNLVSDTNMMHVDGFLVRTWNDQRLKFDFDDPCKTTVNGDKLRLWIPELKCMSGDAFSLHDGSTASTIRSNGTVVHLQRFELSAPCFTDALTYPFGNTSCTMALIGEKLHLAWEPTAPAQPFATVAPIEYVGDLKIVHIDFSKNVSKRSLEEVDELILDIYFTRLTNKIILLFYFPSILIMFISWLSLVLGPMAITRAIMIVGSFALLLAHYSSNMADLPRTTGITAIDIWKVGSMVFVLSTLFELVVVTCMASMGRSRRLTRCFRSGSKKKGRYGLEPLYEELNDLRQRRTRITCSCCRYTALLVDFISLNLFAAAFIMLVVLYFSKYDAIVSYLNDFRFPTVTFS